METIEGEHLFDVTICSRYGIIPERLLNSIEANIPVNKLHVITAKDDEGGGVGVARQMALNRVVTNFYVSIDDDVPELPRHFMPRLLRHFHDPATAVASAVPIYTGNSHLETYYRALYFNSGYVPPTLTAAVLRTRTIKRFGFPPFPAGEDAYLKRLLEDHGYGWIVDLSVEVEQPRTLIEDLNKMSWWCEGAIRLGYPKFYAFKRMASGLRHGLVYGLKYDLHLLYILPIKNFIWAYWFLRKHGE